MDLGIVRKCGIVDEVRVITIYLFEIEASVHSVIRVDEICE